MMPGFLVAMPGATSSFLVTCSNGLLLASRVLSQTRTPYCMIYETIELRPGRDR